MNATATAIYTTALVDVAKSNAVSFCTCFTIYARCCDSSFTTELTMASSVVILFL
ncbi:unnamed protein product [Prunus armeniaca]